MNRILTIIALLLLAGFCYAGTHIPAGPVSGVWDSTGSPYYINGEVHVPTDSMLRIEPGCSIIFNGCFELGVNSNATLRAIGTVTDSIFFTAFDTILSHPVAGHNGIKFSSSASGCTLSYCSIKYSKGIAVHCLGCSPTIINNTISRNTTGKGAGISCVDGSNPVISNNTISYNVATNEGGGIYCRGWSNPSITNNIIIGNTATNVGGAICVIYSSPTISNNIISVNASGRGGGIWCSGGNAIISNNTISGNNAAGNGGGFFIEYGNPTILKNLISNNTAGGGGGGVFSQQCPKHLISNNLIIENSATSGGGICCLFFCDITESILTNNTITLNRASYGGGIYVDESTVILFNTILYNNSASTEGNEIYINGGPSWLVTGYSDLDTTECYFEPFTTIFYWEDGIIDLDPQFVDDDTTGGVDLHLGSGSPCIDAGAESLYIALWDTTIFAPYHDLDDTTRPRGGGWDMGAYESPFTGDSTSPEAPTLIEPPSDTSLAESPDIFRWNIPADPDGDSLYFELEIDSDGDFVTYVDYTYQSWVTPSHFSPAHAPSGIGECVFTSPAGLALTQGHWYWRVKAYDGVFFSFPSTAFHFVIDTTGPLSTIEYPRDSSTFSSLGAIDFYGTADDAVAEIESVRVSFDGGSSWQSIGVTPSGDHYKWTINWTPPSIGAFIIRTKAKSADGLVESAIVHGRNEIAVIIDTTSFGPDIDISPASIVYTYTRGDGGGFARPAFTPGTYEIEHDFDVNSSFIDIESVYPYPHFSIAENGYWRTEINGLENSAVAGAPLLPLDNIKALLPQGKRIDRIEIIEVVRTEIPGSYLLDFGKPPIPIDGPPDFEIPASEPDEEIYESTRPFPESPVGYFSTQFMRGYGCGVINMRPVGYIPAERKLFYYPEIHIRMYLADVEESEIVACRGLEHDRRRVVKAVENPELASSYNRSQKIYSFSPETVPPESSFQYVIISPSAYASAFEPLIDWKKRRGIPSTIYTTEDIYSTYSGVDNPERIRNFILDAYSNWETDFVLLGGDDEYLPHRGVYARGGPFIEHDMPCDMYFGCLDGNWNNDGDSDWGETNDGIGGGDIDWFGDVAIGRCPADEISEVDNFINKTIAYESNPLESYLNQAVMVGEYLWGPAEGCPCVAWGGNSLNMVGNYLPGEWSIATLYERDGTFPNKSVLISQMNSGVHMVNHLGHSNRSINMKMNRDDVDGLINSNYFFAYSQGCYPNAFDEATSGASGSISEHFACEANAAFGYIGNTRYGWGYCCNDNGPSNKFHRKFADALFHGDIRNIGEANQNSKEANIGLIGGYNVHRWCALELCLMGDPETPFVTPSGVKTVTITNTGDSPLNVTDIVGRNTVITAFPDSFTLAPSASQNVIVTAVSEALPAGTTQDTIYFISDDPDEPSAALYIRFNISGSAYMTGGIPPVIDSVALSVHTVEHGSGAIVAFSGSGFDPDGYVTAYEWLGTITDTVAFSSLTDTLRTYFYSTEESFSVDPDTIAAGNYDIIFSVRDNDGNWSIPTIEYLEIISNALHIEINTGWNLLSVPSSTHQPWTIYGNIPYGYDPAISDYYASDSLYPGKGYFVLNTAPDTVEIPRGLFSYTDTLFPGWNLVGALDHISPSHSFITMPPGLGLSPFYGWDNSACAYFYPDSLYPGRGYWFLSSGHGRITVGP